MNIHGNVSHAEHHFVSWLMSQQPLLPQVRSIMLNLQEFSPCATCTGELVTVLNTIASARGRAFSREEAVLTWTKSYPGIRPSGDNATTPQGIRLLAAAGWKMHAPPLEVGARLRFADSPVIIVGPDYRPPK
jgi:hypothetical protein